MLSRKQIALVHAVDQMLDYYELTGKPSPERISVTHDTYDALRKFTGEDKGVEIMQLTHYRKVPIAIVSNNNKT